MIDQFKRERDDEKDVTDIGRAFKAGAEWARDQLKERVAELEAENARLQEAISYLPKVPTKPYEQELARRIVEAEAERYRWREMAEKMAEALKGMRRFVYVSGDSSNNIVYENACNDHVSEIDHALAEYVKLRDGE